MAGDVILWRIIYLDVWLESGVLAEGATHVTATYLRNTEYQTAVHQGLPPYGSHRTSHWRTNQLADAQLLIYPRETMAVAVVVLADQNAGWLGPLVEWILAHHLAVRYKFLVLLAAEQGAEVVVQPAATIVTLIYDDGILGAVLLAQQFTIYGAETLAVHRLHVHIGYSAVRNTVHDGTVSIHPSLVEQLLLGTLRDGLDGEVEALALSVLDGKADVLASLSVEQRIVVFACLDVGAAPIWAPILVFRS